jgi:uncharacterized membrane protein
MSSTTIATITHGVLGLAILAASTTLLALHDLQETTFLALVSASIALITGSAATSLALKVPAPQQGSQTPAGV